MAAVTAKISTKLESFIHAAHNDQVSFTDAKSWARTYARKFYHEVDSTSGFLPVYNTLLNLSHLPLVADDEAINTFEENFDVEFEKSLTTIHEHDNLDVWVRAETDRMYWAFDRQTKWKVIYDAIFDKSLRMIQMYKDSSETRRRSLL